MPKAKTKKADKPADKVSIGDVFVRTDPRDKSGRAIIVLKAGWVGGTLLCCSFGNTGPVPTEFRKIKIQYKRLISNEYKRLDVTKLRRAELLNAANARVIGIAPSEIAKRLKPGSKWGAIDDPGRKFVVYSVFQKTGDDRLRVNGESYVGGRQRLASILVEDFLKRFVEIV